MDQDFLKEYRGVLISDFYPGYDALKCQHQKCLEHLIRDLNDGLWTSPFDYEYGKFVSDFKDLFIPIMEAVTKVRVEEKTSS